MVRTNLLLVEDDAALADLIEWHFEREDYVVSRSIDGEEALRLAGSRRPDVVLLDWMIESLSGIDVCQRLRCLPATATVPIIMLSARATEQDRAFGLGAGADDYITKPFRPRDLVARVGAVLSKHHSIDHLSYADVEMDVPRHRVRRAGWIIPLGPTEYRILKHFLEQPERVLSREWLKQAIWGADASVGLRAVDAHIRRLRKALNSNRGREIIRTVRLFGYAIDGDADNDQPRKM